MKPMGAIPNDFNALALTAPEVTPSFVYHADIVANRVARFRAAFPGVDLHYAVKANPFPALLETLAPLVDGFDAASIGEVGRLSIYDKPVSFAGPGKTLGELAMAIAGGVTINVESEGEAERALALAAEIDVAPVLAVRVNPEFELRGSGMRMGGRASPFGIDAERVPALVKKLLAAGAYWAGFHVFAGSQALDAQAIIDSQAHTLDLVARLAAETGVAPPNVNLGGGFGIPYFPGEVPVDVEAVGAALTPRLADFPGTRFAIELGRWLVGEAGVYFTRVIDRKESRGETFLVCDGGLNHQLAATGNLGTVVRRNYPVAVVGAAPDAPTEVVSVVGPLCTPLDRLADQVELPVAQPGDVIAVFMAGAYGLTASPWEFLGHPRPLETMV